MPPSGLDAIEDASTELNEVGLPNISKLVRSLREMTRLASRDPYMENDERIKRAKEILRAYDAYIK